MKHEHGKSQHVKTSQRLWQAGIRASQAAKACHPGATALHYPSARQQNEAMLGLWQFDDLQTYALCFGCLCGLIARVSLIPDQPTRSADPSLLGPQKPVCLLEHDLAHWQA